MIRLPNNLIIPATDIRFSAIRAQGAGGQHVNKSSSAVQLRFDVRRSSLPAELKQRILQHPDRRISRQGMIVIKAQTYRSQEKNRNEALKRFQALLDKALWRKKRRKVTVPSKSAVKRRLENKQHRAQLKKIRGRVRGID